MKIKRINRNTTNFITMEDESVYRRDAYGMWEVHTSFEECYLTDSNWKTADNDINFKLEALFQDHIKNMNKGNTFKSVLKDTGAFIYSPDKPFTLTSGKKSDFYIDCKKALLTQLGLITVGNILTEQIRLYRPDCVGGMTFGADPIIMATSIACTDIGLKIKPLVFRKEVRKHGTSKQIEGTFEKGDSIIIVEDVITTGSSTIKALDIADKNGLDIKAVVVLVDREEGGVNNVKNKYPVDIISIVKVNDLIKEINNE